MDLTSWLNRCPLVAILRGLTPDEAEPVGAALATAGFTIVEVPLNSPEPMESIRRLSQRFCPQMLVGAGTVMTVEQVRLVADAGGKLIVTPHADPAIVMAAKKAGLLAVPGFFTAAEAFALLRAGADALKLFPAEGANPAMLKALGAVLPPRTRVLPVGGIGVENIPAWRAAGAAGFGIGGALYRPGDPAVAVGVRARALVAAVGG